MYISFEDKEFFESACKEQKKNSATNTQSF